jgi:glutamine cyclotransferase
MVFSCLLIVSCTNTETPSEPTVPQTPSIAFSIAATLPHDTSDFTEGLEFYKGMLMESTGLEGKSRIVQYDPSTGKVVQQISIDPKQFGEGISVFKDTVYQLTYQHNLVNVYTVKGLRRIKELPFKGEGWGLTHDSTYLIATNGGNKLLYFEPQTFNLVKEVEVKEGNTPAVNLNEVEFVNGFIYANQWQYNTILKIDPATGNVVAKMDLSSVEQREKAENGRAGVLNGIAYNPETKKFYVTGKNWAKIYELKLDL